VRRGDVKGMGEESKITKGTLVVEEHHMLLLPPRITVVEGVARNIGIMYLHYAKVRVKFYDSNGEMIGTALDEVYDLASNETWHFSVIYFRRAKSYKIEVETV